MGSCGPFCVLLLDGRCGMNMDGENQAWTVNAEEYGKIYFDSEFISINVKGLHCRRQKNTVKYRIDFYCNSNTLNTLHCPDGAGYRIKTEAILSST